MLPYMAYRNKSQQRHSHCEISKIYKHCNRIYRCYLLFQNQQLQLLQLLTRLTKSSSNPNTEAHHLCICSKLSHLWSQETSHSKSNRPHCKMVSVPYLKIKTPSPAEMVAKSYSTAAITNPTSACLDYSSCAEVRPSFSDTIRAEICITMAF